VRSTAVAGRARLEALGQGRFRVSGVLDAVTVVDVLEQSLERFKAEPQISVDLAGVAEADSAGLALLIEWLRTARQRGQPIQFLNVPAQINALARISEVEDLFASNGAGAPKVESAR
jgi:phospholipid transport system transporter-binding protein